MSFGLDMGYASDTQVHAHFVLQKGMGLVILLALLSPLNQSTGAQVKLQAYSHGTTTCLEGDNGPGLVLLLDASEGGCKTRPSYPYLEIDVRERPVVPQKVIVIGPENWAFRCPNLNEPCEQSLSGTVVFDKFGTKHDAGHYELKFKNREVETGHFDVVCSLPCA